MKNIVINDLAQNEELHQKTMVNVFGGNPGRGKDNDYIEPDIAVVEGYGGSFGWMKYPYETETGDSAALVAQMGVNIGESGWTGSDMGSGSSGN